MSDDPVEDPVEPTPADGAEGAEPPVDGDAPPAEGGDAPAEPAQPPPPPPDPYKFNEKQLAVWEKWQEASKEADADLEEIKKGIAEENQLSVFQVNKIITCGLYAGDRVDGVRHGFGRAILPNGDTYEGHYQNGMRHGKGKYVFKAGGSYEGEYAENKKHGRGVMIYPDGSRYDGEWANDQYNGQGSLTLASGDTYTGSFRNGERHGRGVYTVAATGEVVRCHQGAGGALAGRTPTGLLCGWARAQYDGEWNNGQREGHGTWRLHAGAAFTGVFVAGVPQGRGRYTFAGGYEEEGEYSLQKLAAPVPARFKVIKAGAAEEAEEQPKKKKSTRVRRPPPRPLVEAVQFRGDAYKGVNVYI